MSSTETASLIEELLQPIPGDQPAGDPSAYIHGVRDQLEELRREEDIDDFDDATRPASLKRADWPGVAQLCEEVLTTRSKDLRVACHWIEAQTRLRGFAGLYDGLHFLGRLIEEAWDRMYPALDEQDPEVRAAPLGNMLDDPDHGMRFPVTVRSIPILGRGPTATSLLDLNRLRSAPDADDTLRAILGDTSAESIKQASDDIDRCLEEIQMLIPAMDARMGTYAPSFTQLSAALSDCQRAARQYLPQFASMAADTQPAQAAPSDTPAESAPVEAGPTVTPGSRAEAYLLLQRAADMLATIEPHSPIPYLVRRAIELGRLPFPQLMQELIRDNNVLSDMNRELGIRQEAGSSSN